MSEQKTEVKSLDHADGVRADSEVGCNLPAEPVSGLAVLRAPAMPSATTELLVLRFSARCRERSCSPRDTFPRMPTPCLLVLLR
jgi:hypothetical protein